MPSPLFGVEALVREPSGPLAKKARRSHHHVRRLRQLDIVEDQSREAGTKPVQQLLATRRPPAR
jgi:hypothetical protein